MNKILEIIPDLSVVGGAETFFTNLVIAIKKKGYDSNHLKVICLYAETNSQLCDKLRDEGIEVSYFSKNIGIDIKTAFALRGFIKKYRPNVIHTHSLCIVTLFLALGLYHPHINIFHTFHNEAKLECPLKSQKALYSFLFHFHWAIPIGISKNVSRSITEVFKYKGQIYIDNGAPIDKFGNDKKLSERNIDFIHIGRFEEVKNHRFLIESFKEITLLYPRVSLYCVGVGTLFDEIKELVSNFGITSNVSLLGLRKDIGDLLSCSKCFLLPSQSEGNPISIIEAMAAGLPIIASNVGGIPDVVQDKKNGFLFEVGNKQAFVDKMTYSLEHIDELEKIRNNNIIDAKKYEIEACASKYLAYFNEYNFTLKHRKVKK